jgi:hypothetical protein
MIGSKNAHKDTLVGGCLWLLGARLHCVPEQPCTVWPPREAREVACGCGYIGRGGADGGAAGWGCGVDVAQQSERFVIPQAKRAYIQQYAQLYFTRLKLLEPRVRAALQAQVPTAKGTKHSPCRRAV